MAPNGNSGGAAPIPPDFAAINAAALRDLPNLLGRWLQDGRCVGREYVARNPRRADRHAGSFKVNLQSGRWADFATDDRGGDPVSLTAFLFGLTQGVGRATAGPHVWGAVMYDFLNLTGVDASDPFAPLSLADAWPTEAELETTEVWEPILPAPNEPPEAGQNQALGNMAQQWRAGCIATAMARRCSQ